MLQPLVGSEPLVIQHGHTPPRSAWIGTEWFQFVPYETMTELMRSARCVVCSAGEGAIITALGLSVRPIVIPRRGVLNEHVDDHQLEIAHAFEQGDLVTVWREDEPAESVLARPRELLFDPASGRASALAAAVRKAAEGVS